MIPETTRLAGPFAGDDTTTVFPFTFVVFSEDDVKVTQSTDGVETVLTSGYTVSVNADQDADPGGDVTLTTALPTGDILAISGGTAYSQTLELPDGGNFSPASLNRALDRIVMQVQQLKEILDRTSATSVTDGVNPTLPSPVADAFLAWNSTADELVNVTGLASAPVSSAMEPVVAASTLALARSEMGVAAQGAVTTSGLTVATARVLGRTTAGTGALEELTAAQVSAFAAAASDTAQGVVELATTAEVRTGTDTARAVTPAAMQAGKLVSIGQTSLSGSETIVTGIPSWAKRVTVLVDVASTSATAIVSLRLGDSGGIESSGYAGVVGGGVTGNACIAQTSTSGFQINMTGLDTASFTYTARITLDLMDAASFKWVCSGTVYPNTGTATSLAMTGYKSTSAALDRVSLVTSAGTFDGGSIQVTYE